jgi:uncharacterized protein (DUF1800 family)
MDRKYWDAAHLFRRAGFGATHSEIMAHKDKSWSALVDMVMDTSRAPRLAPAPDLSPGRDWYDKYVDMTWYWLDRARRPVTQAPITEKMTLFWHGFLCSSLEKVNDHKMMFDQNQLFRTKGLGGYQRLLWETSIGPAMLRYLDNDRNSVGNVNENFARELMELFVTGVGHYTEADVRESARAWTGHGLTDDGRYRFSSAVHDHGSKTFLGQRGNWDGDDIIRLLLTRRRDAHARFLCQRLWSFFAYPVRIGGSEVTDIARVYKQNLHIGATVRAIFLHPNFRTDRARHGLLRSPIEYVVACMRHTRTDCATVHPEWYLSEMGQRPFHPPNVSGWRQNEYWVSESAVWAKGQMASHLRWRLYDRGDITDVHKVIDWNPVTYKLSPTQSVDRALANMNLRLKTARSRQLLVDYVESERASDQAWGQRAGLLMLPLLTPEMQLA